MSTKQQQPLRVEPLEDARPRESASVSSKPDGQFYRCPACGKMVDGSDREAVHRHHDHVRSPLAYASQQRHVHYEE